MYRLNPFIVGAATLCCALCSFVCFVIWGLAVGKFVCIVVQNGWDKLLIDAVNAKPKMSVLDDFEFTRNHQMHFPASLRTAIIHHPDATEGFGFIENVGQNRGMFLKLFTDQTQALVWLLNT